MHNAQTGRQCVFQIVHRHGWQACIQVRSLGLATVPPQGRRTRLVPHGREFRQINKPINEELHKTTGGVCVWVPRAILAAKVFVCPQVCMWWVVVQIMWYLVGSYILFEHWSTTYFAGLWRRRRDPIGHVQHTWHQAGPCCYRLSLSG